MLTKDAWGFKIYSSIAKKPKKQSVKNSHGFQHSLKRAFWGIHIGPKAQVRPTKQVYQDVANKNSVSTSGTKEAAKTTNKSTLISNSFDILSNMANNVVEDSYKDLGRKKENVMAHNELEANLNET
ncbi:hypothetical protein Tco_0510886 [Tanacetum coccineum]